MARKSSPTKMNEVDNGFALHGSHYYTEYAECFRLRRSGWERLSRKTSNSIHTIDVHRIAECTSNSFDWSIVAMISP